MRSRTRGILTPESRRWRSIRGSWRTVSSRYGIQDPRAVFGFCLDRKRRTSITVIGEPRPESNSHLRQPRQRCEFAHLRALNSASDALALFFFGLFSCFFSSVPVFPSNAGISRASRAVIPRSAAAATSDRKIQRRLAIIASS